jgi:hypothetical protein
MTQLNESTRKEVEILRVLSENNTPIGSILLRRELIKRGFLLSERTIRYHLQLLEAKGLVQGHYRSGRTITVLGLEELSRSIVHQRVGFIATRFLTMAYSVTYDPNTDKGMAVTNVFIMDKNFYNKIITTVKALREIDILPAPYIKILDEEEEYQDISVPKGKIALFTVCNLTIDGVLIHSGIPMSFEYGGLIQFLNRKPTRFVELISYEGTTIPPLEVFVYKNMTSITKIVEIGSGMLPATLREIPAKARESTEKILIKLKNKGWGGVLVLGKPNESVLGVPVSMDRFALCMVGGLVPGAAMVEKGVKVDTFAPHCLIPVEEMTRI